MANRDDDFYDDDEYDDYDDTMDMDDAPSSRGPLIVAGLVILTVIGAFLIWSIGFNSGDKDTQTITADQNAVQVASDGTADTGMANGVEDVAAAPALQVEAVDNGVPAASAVTAPPANAVTSTPTAPAPRPATPAAAPSASTSAASVAPAPRPATTSAPAAARPTATTPPRPAATATPRPAATTPSTAPKATTAPAAATAQGTNRGAFSAQLGSFPERASAERQLANYRAQGLSAGNQGALLVVPANLGDRGTWYRIRATGFDSRAEAVAFCDAAKANGAPCIPARN